MATVPVDTILVAKVSFQWDGGMVRQGATVRIGHPILEGRAALFGPIEVDYDYDYEYEPPAPARHARTKAGG